MRVEAIGRNSNLGHLRNKWADLCKCTSDSPARPPRGHEDLPKPRFKRFLSVTDIKDIGRRYEVGETTRQIGTCYGISKTRVAAVLRDEGITIRRQGLTDVQVLEAAALYADGRSLAWIGAHYGVSHTTIAAALRRNAIPLRRRPGWS